MTRFTLCLVLIRSPVIGHEVDYVGGIDGRIEALKRCVQTTICSLSRDHNGPKG